MWRIIEFCVVGLVKRPGRAREEVANPARQLDIGTGELAEKERAERGAGGITLLPRRAIYL
jgi:hypothetical protein